MPSTGSAARVWRCPSRPTRILSDEKYDIDGNVTTARKLNISSDGD